MTLDQSISLFHLEKACQVILPRPVPSCEQEARTARPVHAWDQERVLFWIHFALEAFLPLLK
jgi:hypothetical protein